MEQMRMFPLGHPLIPFTLLPLRIFEPRYLQMISECLDQSAPFGVVLIERGLEVGGGETRSNLGTVAQIVEVSEFDHEMTLVAVGVERLDVVEWMPDDPYPVAMVNRREEAPSQGSAARIPVIDEQLRTVLALVSETGVDVGPVDYQLSDQPEVAAFQMCGLAPVGAFDAQRLLASNATEERLDLLEAMLGEQKQLITAQLGGA